MDYYKILELKRDCTDAQIKQAYRRKAIQWHPDKNEGKREQAEAKFLEISEAYAVLSNARFRAVFDQYGAKGLKQGVPNGKGGYVQPWTYNTNPDEQFAEFFGSFSPFADFFMEESGSSSLFAPDPKAGPAKVGALEQNLYCSLEELFIGCSKKVKVVRQKLNLDGKACVPDERVLSVEVQAGWKEGTKITFQCEGDEAAGQETGDIIFTLKEKPHPRFERAKNDLVFEAKISLSEALCGSTVNVQTLDSRTIPIPVNEVVKPGFVKIVPNEGMPQARDPTKRGNLRITFDVTFPDMLSEREKTAITQILSP
jgi:DnaJ family protein B protein 13